MELWYHAIENGNGQSTPPLNTRTDSGACRNMMHTRYATSNAVTTKKRNGCSAHRKSITTWQSILNTSERHLPNTQKQYDTKSRNQWTVSPTINRPNRPFNQRNEQCVEHAYGATNRSTDHLKRWLAMQCTKIATSTLEPNYNWSTDFTIQISSTSERRTNTYLLNR